MMMHSSQGWSVAAGSFLVYWFTTHEASARQRRSVQTGYLTRLRVSPRQDILPPSSYLTKDRPMNGTAHDSDEDLLKRFYAGDTAALDALTDRYHELLARVIYLLLFARTGSDADLATWDIH